MIILRAAFGHDDPASPLRRRVNASLSRVAQVGTADAWIDDVLIVVSELVQNVSQHTGGGGELTLSLTPDGLLVEVADTAVAPPQLRHPDPRHAGGRGLLLIDAISLSWGTRYRQAGKTVWSLMPACVAIGSLPASA